MSRTIAKRFKVRIIPMTPGEKYLARDCNLWPDSIAYRSIATK